MPQRSLLASPPVVAVAGWVLPGSGYVLLGDVARGLVIGSTIILLFLAGVLIAGIRVIDVPGYDNLGHQKRVFQGRRVDPSNPSYARGDWLLAERPLGEVVEKPWFVAQALTGPIAFLGASWSISAAQPATPGGRVSAVPNSHARIADIGSLYTAVAGMLNLLTIIDSAGRAGRSAESPGRGGRGIAPAAPTPAAAA